MRLRTTRHHKPEPGFTLLELLLVVVLVVALTSALVFNFSNLLRGNQLLEGTTRLETLMRFARAQAANSGRKVQLVFSAESTNAPAAATGEVRATWEPDPLAQPGCFAELIEAQWHLQEINDLVQVESVKLLDSTTAAPPNELEDDVDLDAEGWEGAPTKSMAPITFYPDGSSDSAEIIVAARSEEQQRMSVRLVGVTGSITHQLLAASFDPFDLSSEGQGSTDANEQLFRDPSVPEAATDPDAGARGVNSRPAASSARPVPAAPRAPVGETNRVDQSD